jgi:CysZ protein
MLAAVSLAISDVLSPEFRSAMLKSLGLALLLLLALWASVEGLVAWAIDLKAHPWLETAIDVITGVGLLIGLGFLVVPVTAIFAGMFTERIARAVEQLHYPRDPPGQDMPMMEAIRDTIVFAGLAIAVNLIALALLLLPGVNAIAFLLGNGYLLGRAFFETIARRYLSREEVRAARLANRGKVILAGLIIAAIAAVPILNLITPLFATAFMLHLYKRTVEPALRRG